MKKEKHLPSFYCFYTGFFSEAIFQVLLHTCYSKGLNVLIILASFVLLSRELEDGCAEEGRVLQRNVDTYSLVWVIISFESLTEEGFLKKQCYCLYKPLLQELMKI